MPNFVRFMDQGLPGERLLNLDQVEACCYLPNAQPLELQIWLVSGEFIALRDWTAVAVWAYLTAAMHCRTVVIGERPSLTELEEVDL
ncbi:hypothetical protein HNI00_07325 [Thermoleptolyngbya oregonensis NK1-22]|uniref:Uncharacterized protein n=1 Tax=Thermoleptolyngbya oregonensis NK1-22 TaxID=2547457 RepID=A0AA97BLB9_9CYAN|nr:hypothetical protein [Thermoleptolyngbya oregonensis]WOB42987.1 hypothetical protein HNI00_07325 [Thermoleptolyngbya oregonensis NK1-22]